MKKLLVLLFLFSASPVEGISLDERKQLAEKWFKEIYKLDNAIPALSPSQKEWLDREYFDELKRSGNKLTKRSISAANSVEYSLLKAKRYSKENVLLISLLMVGVHDREKEILYWVKLANNFASPSFGQEVFGLIEHEVLDRSFLMPTPTVGFPRTRELQILNTVLFGQQILERILIPMLEQP